MLLDFNKLVEKYKVKAKGVIAVGAHYGEEYNDYISNGIKNIVFVEPCRKAFEELYRRFRYADNVFLFNVACGENSGTGIMYTGDNTINKGQSNSLLKPAKHLQIHPTVEFDGEEEVDVELLDTLGVVGKEYQLLVMDCQGYEGHVLRGAKEVLKQINWVYTEVNRADVYENCAMVDEIDSLLSEFTRVETGAWVGNAWTDAFFVRTTLLK